MMKFFFSILSIIATLFCTFPLIFSMEHKLRNIKSLGVNNVALFVEGFSPESIFRMKMTIKTGLEEAIVTELNLEDLKKLKPGDFQIITAPSEVKPGSESIVKEGMDIIAGIVKEGSLLFSHLDSSSPLCKEFKYNGSLTVNSNYIYNGLCVGPITKPGPMKSECRAVMAFVESRNKADTYNNFFVSGGFYFEDIEKNKNCQVIARATPRDNSKSLIEYRQDSSSVPLVIVCKYGKGAAILSGIPLDQNAAFLAGYVKKNPEETHVKEVLAHLSNISDFSKTLLHFLGVLKFTGSLK